MIRTTKTGQLARTSSMGYLVTVLVNVMPFVALAAVGIILVCQHRTLVTVLVALGFSVGALSEIAGNALGSYAFFGGPEEISGGFASLCFQRRIRIMQWRMSSMPSKGDRPWPRFMRPIWRSFWPIEK
jgi:hypothetical protein